MKGLYRVFMELECGCLTYGGCYLFMFSYIRRCESSFVESDHKMPEISFNYRKFEL